MDREECGTGRLRPAKFRPKKIAFKQKSKGEEYMIKKIAGFCLSCALMAGPMFGNEGAVPKSVPKLDHVFVIIMENHGFNQIIGNPNAPFTI